MVHTRKLQALSGPEYPEVVHKSVAQNWPLAFARFEFLHLLDEEEPEVRNELHEKVFPLFPAALRKAPDNLPAIYERDLQSNAEAVAWFYKAHREGRPAAGKLFSALHDWAESYHLAVDWIADAALRTMIAWSQDSSLFEERG